MALSRAASPKPLLHHMLLLLNKQCLLKKRKGTKPRAKGAGTRLKRQLKGASPLGFLRRHLQAVLSTSAVCGLMNGLVIKDSI